MGNPLGDGWTTDGGQELYRDNVTKVLGKLKRLDGRLTVKMYDYTLIFIMDLLQN